MRQRNRAPKIFAVIFAGILSVSVMLLSACSKTENYFVIPQVDLPTEERYALKQYDYENLSDVQTTIRADVRNVLERNLPRPETEYLGDDFSLVYNSATNELTAEYELVETDATLKTATISFDKYPAPNLKTGVGDLKNAESVGYGTGVYCDGSDAFSNGTMNGEAVDPSNTLFYKYMLITQGQHLTAEAAYRSTNGTLTQEWLKKHPAADAQYGAVLGTDNAVKKEITLDPIYRSYHATGLYMPAGEVVTVNVEGLKAGEYITVFLGLQDSLAWRGGADTAAFNEITGGISQVKALDSDSSQRYFTKADVLVANNMSDKISLQGQWARQNARLPWLHAEFTFTENKEYKIGTPFGGLIEIGMGNCYSHVKTTFTGAVETPHYVLGQTTPEYFDEYLRDAPGVIAVLDTENGQLVGPTGEMGTSGYMRQIKAEEVDKLAMLWHSFFSVDESFTGGIYNRFNKVMFDWHVPAGAAVALGNYSFAHPTTWFGGAMNYRGLLSSGTWGVLHEIGHNHHTAYGKVWGFGCGQEGEVRNNALTLLAYIMLCDVGTTIRNGGSAEHGGYANPYSTLMETLANKGAFADASNCGYFQILGMYANIMHSFGAEKYYELLYTYKTAPEYYYSNLRADFAYRCSRVYGMNFIKYFNDFYGANIDETTFTEEHLAEMRALPNYEPISCFYAGGIDGVKTAGDYIVRFGDDITFDLYNNTVSSLDTADAKGFEILGVNRPEHGTIKAGGDGKWIYSFNKKYTGNFDTFTFDVKLADGVVHTLSVTLRISYNGARLISYNDVQGSDFDEISADVASRQPDLTENIASADITTYRTDTGKKDVRISEFYWRAPVSGEISISAKWDDWVKVYFGKDFDHLEEILTGTHDISTYQEYNVTQTVSQGEFYAVRIFNVNTGGGGSASMAVKNEAGNYVQLDSADVFHPSYPLGQPVPTFVYEPQFIVSKKDNIKLSSTGTDKGQWSVVTAPDNVNGGRYEEQQLVDPDTGLPLEGEDGILKTDKRDWLIDGQTSTIFHTAWLPKDGIKPPTPDDPDIFVIDTAKIQPFNYFTVTTRLTQNDDARITSYELFISDDNEHYTQVSAGDELAYVNTSGTKVANIDFDQVVNDRYWKLVVKGTSGKNFTIISEIDAGVRSTTQQVVPPTSNKLYATSGWINSATVTEEPNGYLISEKKNQKLVIRFRGESIALYGATGTDFGSADVRVDGKSAGSFDLNSDIEESRKLIFYSDNLNNNKEHTVEIITTSANKVMLSIIGIPYTAELMNAPNIYKERALIISLAVFVVLFALITTLVLLMVFVPKFRNACFGNRFVKKIDEKEKTPKSEHRGKPADESVKDKNASASKSPEVKSVSKPTSSTTAKPASSAPARPTANSTAKPASSAPTRPTANSTAKPTSSTPTRPTANSTAKPASSATAKPTTKPKK